MGLDESNQKDADETLPAALPVREALPMALAKEDVATPSPWLRRVRGRLPLLLSIVILCAVAGATIGYGIARPTYRAQGSLLLMPESSKLQADNSDSPQTLDTLAEVHMARIGNADQLKNALNSDAWRLLGRRADEDATRSFRGALGVTRDPDVRSRINITFSDHDSHSALVGVNAVLDQYRQLTAMTTGVSSIDASIRHANEHLATTSQKLALAKQELAAAMLHTQPHPLDEAYAAKLTELNTLAVLINEARAEMARTPEPRAGQKAMLPTREETLAQLAQTDSVLGGLLIRKQDINQQLAELLQRMGEKAPTILSLRHELAWTESEIDRRLDAPRRQAQAAGAKGLPGVDAQQPAQQTAGNRLDRLVKLQKQAEDQVKDISARLTQIRTLEHRVGTLQKEADDAAVLVARFQAAASNSQGVIFNNADASSVSIARDPRPLTAGLGALLGLCLGVCAAAAVASTDQRLRHPDAVQRDDMGLPLLGTVPVIDANSTDPRRMDLTALSIHEIRALLQTRAKRDNARTFAITSPGAGSGKTSLTVGLASSLALSGVKTLLVDCDLANRVLNPTTTREQKPDSSGVSQRQSLDQVMLDMGYLNRTDAEIFLYPTDAKVGLLGMLDGKPLRHCAVETNIPGLSILPALSAEATHIGRMSGQFIQRLIGEARDEYDMILFDTGPIPGSVEALFVAGEVDGVVLVAAQGESQSKFDKSVAYLKLVNAKLAGVVFNRTLDKDLTLVNTPRTSPQADDAAVSSGNVRRLPAHSRNMGSGIFAAAIQFQAKTPAATEGIPGAGNPGHSPRPMGAPAQEISLSDTGDITRILMEDDTGGDNEHGHLNPVITAEIDKIKKPGTPSRS